MLMGVLSGVAGGVSSIGLLAIANVSALEDVVDFASGTLLMSLCNQCNIFITE